MVFRCTSLFAILGTLAHGELAWDAKEKYVDSALGESRIHEVFRFSNTGSSSIKILEVKRSCGCTTTDLEDKDIAPGESGELVVEVDLEGLSGSQAKTISVYTDQSSEPTVLYLLTDVPQRFELSPNILAWNFRGKLKTRRADIVFNPEYDWSLDQLKSEVQDRENLGLGFSVVMKEGKIPGTVLVEVVPEHLKKLGHSYLTVKHVTEDGEILLGEIYLTVN